MAYRVRGLDPDQFAHLFGLSDEGLAKLGARRRLVADGEGIPDRIGVRELQGGETAILLNYVHQPADTPYRASHAIFIAEGAGAPCDLVDAIPDQMQGKMISIRAFGANHELASADLAVGAELPPIIARFFDNPDVAYLQAHYARPGCYAARIERA
ncbi:DUF1203 domain-containing protein [Caulobacter sp. S45]|uniref:DUF1203 domain-containing protein n=1 Tax=Caulobacter sp. S45 TaxID=1641861 RepID=UPI00131DF1BE|nr:DUF1203 domain-containing protein [Caulobacter sp. S45]